MKKSRVQFEARQARRVRQPCEALDWGWSDAPSAFAELSAIFEFGEDSAAVEAPTDQQRARVRQNGDLIAMKGP